MFFPWAATLQELLSCGISTHTHPYYKKHVNNPHSDSPPAARSLSVSWSHLHPLAAHTHSTAHFVTALLDRHPLTHHFFHGTCIFRVCCGRNQPQLCAGRFGRRLVSAAALIAWYSISAAYATHRYSHSHLCIRWPTKHTASLSSITSPFLATMECAIPRVEYISDDSRPRRTNGATQTFRRPSHATTLSGSTAQTPRDASGPQNTSVPTPGVYVPPHAQPGRSGEGRYARDQMLHLFRSHRESDELQDGLSGLYVGNWEPNISNGTSASNWGRKDDHGREGQGGVDLCWDRDGNVQPLGLNNLNEDEKEVCPTSCAVYPRLSV